MSTTAPQTQPDTIACRASSGGALLRVPPEQERQGLDCTQPGRDRRAVWLIGQRGISGSVVYGLRLVELAAVLQPWRPPRTRFRNAIAAQTAALMLTLMRQQRRSFTPGGLFGATYDRMPRPQETKQISMALGTLKGLGLIQCTFSRQGTKDIRFRHVSDVGQAHRKSPHNLPFLDISCRDVSFPTVKCPFHRAPPLDVTAPSLYCPYIWEGGRGGAPHSEERKFSGSRWEEAFDLTR